MHLGVQHVRLKLIDVAVVHIYISGKISWMTLFMYRCKVSLRYFLVDEQKD